MSLKGPSALPRWVPTSELELYNAEAAILGPIRPIISQRTVAGLNTICSVHEKMPASDLPRFDPFEEEVPTPPSTPVAAQQSETEDIVSPTLGSDRAEDLTRRSFRSVAASRSKLDGRQTTALRPLDKDNYGAIVCVHGYAGGVANWLPIWRQLATDYDLYALDLPGFGRNERPAGVTFPTAESAIDWYVSQFEAWFNEMRIGLEDVGVEDEQQQQRKKGEEEEGPSLDSVAVTALRRPAGRKLIIMAHSFGGYLASHLLIRHPSLADHLVLVDGFGINRYRPRNGPDDLKRKKEQSKVMAALDYMLEGVYWGKLLSFCGPFAQKLLPMVRPEFSDSWGPFLEDPQHFYTYSYHCNVQRPFIGEAAFEAIRVKEGITAAKIPLIDLTHKFPHASGKKQKQIHSPPSQHQEHQEQSAGLTPIPDSSDNLLVPRVAGEGVAADDNLSCVREGFKITMLYGSNSWLRSPVLDEFVHKLRDENGLDVSFTFIENAGHMPLVDNMPMFVDELRKRL